MMPPMPSSANARLYALAVLSGTVAEGGLALAVFGGAPQPLAILLFVEALVLGLVFGARPGMAGAVVPMMLLFAAEVVRRAVSSGASGDSLAGALGALVFVSVLLAFCAGMAGALRDRYFRGGA